MMLAMSDSIDSPGLSRPSLMAVFWTSWLQWILGALCCWLQSYLLDWFQKLLLTPWPIKPKKKKMAPYRGLLCTPYHFWQVLQNAGSIKNSDLSGTKSNNTRLSLDSRNWWNVTGLRHLCHIKRLIPSLLLLKKCFKQTEFFLVPELYIAFSAPQLRNWCIYFRLFSNLMFQLSFFSVEHKPNFHCSVLHHTDCTHALLIWLKHVGWLWTSFSNVHKYKHSPKTHKACSLNPSHMNPPAAVQSADRGVGGTESTIKSSRWNRRLSVPIQIVCPVW